MCFSGFIMFRDGLLLWGIMGDLVCIHLLVSEYAGVLVGAFRRFPCISLFWFDVCDVCLYSL